MDGCAAPQPDRLTSMAEQRSILHSLVTKFNASDEAQHIAFLSSAFRDLKARRAHNLAQSQAVLHQWMRKVDGAKWEAMRPADKSEEAHAERMGTLEREHFALGKATTELELAVQREEAALAALRERAASVAERTRALGAEAATPGVDGIRSQLYRQNLGLHWLLDDASDACGLADFGGRALRCVVNSQSQNDVFTLDIPAAPHAERVANQCALASSLWALISPQ